MNEEIIKEKLYEGQVIKNYKELCKILNINILSGNSKISQLKDLKCYFLYHRDKNKFIIDEIYNDAKSKLDKRVYNGKANNKGKYKEYKQFKIKKDKFNNIGVYYIIRGMDIYIGSTVSSFRNRFQEHLYGYIDYMKHTYDLLQNNGEFHILYDMTDVEDIELIRMVENEYIQYFKEYTDFNVINHMNEATWKGKNYKQKYKNIKIKIEDYNNALKVLEENGIEI